MKILQFFFKGLRGKLILTYTLVTVLALLALEALIFISVMSIGRLTNQDRLSYLEDIVTTLYPDAKKYLQPGEENIPGLQEWLDQVYASGLASLEPQGIFDSPAAKIVPGSTMFVLSTDSEVVAQTPRGETDLVGSKYPLEEDVDIQRIIQKGLAGSTYIPNLYFVLADGTYRMAVPIYKVNRQSDVVGVILVTVEKLPGRPAETWAFIIGVIAFTGIMLLFMVGPFGALFGFIMSHGLTKRLKKMTQVADRWGEGDFSAMPVDRSQDEIGHLSRRMRAMAERIQGLMLDRQMLAQMKERNRIAQELHDTVKQQTFATLMQVRAARNLLSDDPVAAEKSLLEAENLIKASQKELGLVIAELRPAALDGKGLTVALKDYLAGWSINACIPATLEVKLERELSTDVEWALYRMAQEGLSNVARHSRASAVQVILEDSGKVLRFEVCDNGVGFDVNAVSPSGYGLVSMRERLAEVNGKLVVLSHPETGTRLIAEIPWMKQDEERRNG